MSVKEWIEFNRKKKQGADRHKSGIANTCYIPAIPAIDTYNCFRSENIYFVVPAGGRGKIFVLNGALIASIAGISGFPIAAGLRWVVLSAQGEKDRNQPGAGPFGVN